MEETTTNNSSIGYPRFTIVCNGMEAVNAAESESFDVILMDVMVLFLFFI